MADPAQENGLMERAIHQDPAEALKQAKEKSVNAWGKPMPDYGKHEDEAVEAHAHLYKNIIKLDPALAEHLNAESQHFRKVPKTGVIYVMMRAREKGFSMDSPEWANLGQGAPECGEIPGQPQRSWTVTLDPHVNEYAPVDGDKDLRTAVANYYNHMYRKGKQSQYSFKNVCIVAGGRSGLTRVMAAFGHQNAGYFVPDYTSYEELLGCWKRISPMPVLHSETGQSLSIDELRKEVVGRGLGAMLLSNPANPTGQLIEGEELSHWVTVAREEGCVMLMDEFYSHYIYTQDPQNLHTVSSAEYVDDVNVDPVLIVNGLTKNWRVPGWRVCWVVGPESCIEKLASSGSYLDGGANHPLQRHALPMLDIDFILKDTLALQTHFRAKRDFMVSSLRQLGFVIEHEPQGTFYIWACLANLPPPLNDCIVFFELALDEKVICVPGLFFDINPNKRRQIHSSPFITYVRFSYGPPMEQLKRGVQNLTTLIDKWRAKQDN